MYFTQFVLTLTGTLVIMTFVLAWMLRSSSAGLGWKIIIPTFLVAMGCYLPYTAASIMGNPIVTAKPPCNFRLLGYNVQKEYVDMWVMEKGNPRTYRVPLNDDLENIFDLNGDVAGRLAVRDEVFLQCVPGTKAPHYTLSHDAFSDLPSKDPNHSE